MDIAIITGASSGLGEQFLRKLVCEHGAFGSVPFEQIWIVARRADRLNALKNELAPDRIRVFELDLTVPGAIDLLAGALAEEKPNIGLLINCAGFGRTGLLEDQTPLDIRSMIALNCSVPAELTRVCLPYMIPVGDVCEYQNGPRILNIASSAAFMPQPGFAAYAATKAFLVSFSRAMNAELRPHNIASTTVCPGPISTDFLATATGEAAPKFSGIKALFVVKPDKLAAKAITASRKGRAVLVYGLSQKAFHVAAKILPARFMMFLASKFAGGSHGETNTGSTSTKSADMPAASAPPQDFPTTVLLPWSTVSLTPRAAESDLDIHATNQKTEVSSSPSVSSSQSDLPAYSQRNSNASSPKGTLKGTSDLALSILASYPSKR
jgi:hypothetical protein